MKSVPTNDGDDGVQGREVADLLFDTAAMLRATRARVIEAGENPDNTDELLNDLARLLNKASKEVHDLAARVA